MKRKIIEMSLLIGLILVGSIVAHNLGKKHGREMVEALKVAE